MPIYDISVTIDNKAHVWPGDPRVSIQTNHHPADNGSHTVLVTTIRCGSHTGTHVDAPAHMLGPNARTLSDISFDQLIGSARVVEMTGRTSIGRSDIESQEWDGVERILFKTENSSRWADAEFYEDFVFLEPEAATLLVARGIRLVGIDYLSIDGYRSPKHPSHFALLSNSVVILEGLNLLNVPPGDYELIALPIKLGGADGAPVRAVLRN
jgi:arylformamidase